MPIVAKRHREPSPGNVDEVGGWPGGMSRELLGEHGGSACARSTRAGLARPAFVHPHAHVSLADACDELDIDAVGVGGGVVTRRLD